ncbi:MAG: 6-bladed beta-propeller, partial [Microcystis sp. LE19-196.1B]|nr:6-bladed beta-propeller [Microcystis sp. LE19-196.1B]
VDSGGNIYVTDNSNNRVQIFNSSGVFQSTFGSTGPGNGEFSNPFGLAVGSGGNIYVTDFFNDRVQVFNDRGVFQFAFGSDGSGNGEFDRPFGIAVDSGGNIYVVDRFNNRVQVFNPSGVFQSAFGSPGSGNGEFSSPYGIAVDSARNIYVVDTGNDRVQVFNSRGVFQSAFGSRGSGFGQFFSPQGIAVDSGGNIYVVEGGNNRVQVFSPFTSPPGSTPQNPILPTPTPGVPGFNFPNVSVVAGQTFFFDPDVAVGYDYAVTGGPLFSSVLIPAPLPQGDSDFLLELGGFGNFPLVAGTPFDLLSVNPLGFSNFRISGIDTNELLDPTNPVAFVTGLEFTTAGTVNVTQTPIIQNVPDPVRTPEPSSLIGLGILGGGLVVRRLAKRR